jgi:SAM-dependent methyltransferase
LSGVTKSLSNHFRKIVKNINKDFNKDNKEKLILDIGSNDGTFLKHAKTLGWNILGVESSSNIAKIANKNGIKTINDFFNLKLAKSINKKFDFINASGVFFHLEELHSVTQGIKYLLKENGTFVVQFLYMSQIIRNLAFDQIYHEHLCYYNLKTLNKLLNIYDLEIFDCYLEKIHGGQMVAYVSHKNFREKTKRFQNYIIAEEMQKFNTKKKYLQFSKDIKSLKYKNIKFIENALTNNKLIYGMGAPVKGNTLLNYFGFNSIHIKKLLEINNLREGLFAPGSHIPVELENKQNVIPDIFYVLAWNFKKEILNKNKINIKNGVEFYFPIDVTQ